MHYSQRFKIISEGNSNFADSNIFPSNKRCLDDIIVKLINTDHIEPFGPAQVIPDSSISFLTSGGTIACNPSDNRGSAPQSLDSIIHSISDESSILELFKPVDSSQLTSSHFSTILKQAIATIQTNKIGILSHGTDTLGNNAYALSILLHPYLRLHQVSFFITGSFMSSDGVFNLSQTFLIAKNHSSDFPPDVYVCIKSHETDEEMAIIPGNQFEKIQTHPDNQSSGLKRDPIFVSGQAFGTFRNNKFYKSQHIPSQEPPFEHGKLSSAHPKWKMLKNIILAKTNPLSQPYPSVLPNIFVYIVSQWTTSKELESISHQFSKPNNPFTGLFIYHSSGNVDFASQLKVISKVIPILIFKEMPVLSINRKVTPLLNEPTLHTDLNTEKNPNFLFFNHTNFQ
ncbi:hypothetical protein HOG98_06875, partial [bacterium]|nr:hypothetical protein [bacterium]